MPAFRLHAEAIPFVARIGANQYFHNWYESEAKELFGRRLIFYAIPGQRFGTTPRSHLLEAGTTWSGSLENSARDIDIREGDLTWNTNPYSSDQAPESRELELAWIEKNQDTLIKLSGQWIVLEGESLFSANNSLAEALQEAKKRGVRYPFVYKIPSESELPMAL
jgi:hypothetical protein